MKLLFSIVAVSFLLCFLFACWAAHRCACVIDVYSANARTPLFTGFITMASFLLTLKSTILQRLKDGFDSAKHQEAYRIAKEHGVEGRYYESLSNMSSALSITVFMALVASCSQLTLGFIRSAFTFAFCVSLPFVTLVLLIHLWRQISLAHNKWIDKIEDETQKKLADSNPQIS